MRDRKGIEVLLNANSLKEFEDFKYFTDKIGEVDEKYRSVTFDISWHTDNWWEKSIAKICWT
ncbi:hypothetical protein [Solitalea canadensis]|nr:hypothetical protein [Solitalea canadensis]